MNTQPQPRTLSGDIKNSAHWIGDHKVDLASLALAASVVTGVFAETVHLKHEGHLKASAEALMNANSVRDSVYILKAGTNIRTSPAIDTAEVGDNLAQKVPDGKIRIVRQPIEVKNGWVGFSLSSDPSDIGKIKSLKERAAETVYVKLDELEATGHALETAYQSVSGEDSMAIAIGENGQIIDHKNGKSLQHIGLSMEADESAENIGNFILLGEDNSK